jgi:hypothetical protein
MHGDALVLRAARSYESSRAWNLPVPVVRGRGRTAKPAESPPSNGAIRPPNRKPDS